MPGVVLTSREAAEKGSNCPGITQNHGGSCVMDIIALQFVVNFGNGCHLSCILVHQALQGVWACLDWYPPVVEHILSTSGTLQPHLAVYFTGTMIIMGSKSQFPLTILNFS